MNSSSLGLIVYILYLPVLLVMIVVAKSKYNHFSFSKNLLSQLAETISPVSWLVSLAIFLFGLLSFFFVREFSRYLPEMVFSKISLFFLYLNCFCGLLISFFPRDKFRKVHGVIGTFLAVGIIGSLLFLIYPLAVSGTFPKILVFLNILIIIFAILLLFSDFIVSNKLDGLVSKHRSLWQWSMLSLIVAWDFIVAIFILLHR